MVADEGTHTSEAGLFVGGVVAVLRSAIASCGVFCVCRIWPSNNEMNKGLGADMALHVLAYNLTRVMNILGVQPLLAAMRA